MILCFTHWVPMQVSTSPIRLAEDVLALKTIPPRKPYVQGGPEDIIKRINEVVFMK